MKKIIAVLVLVISATHLTHAQQKPIRKPVTQVVPAKPAEAQAWIGIFAGPNLNYLEYHDESTTIRGKNTSFHAGIFYERKILKSFVPQPSI